MYLHIYLFTLLLAELWFCQYVSQYITIIILLKYRNSWLRKLSYNSDLAHNMKLILYQSPFHSTPHYLTFRQRR